MSIDEQVVIGAVMQEELLSMDFQSRPAAEVDICDNGNVSLSVVKSSDSGEEICIPLARKLETGMKNLTIKNRHVAYIPEPKKVQMPSVPNRSVVRPNGPGLKTPKKNMRPSIADTDEKQSQPPVKRDHTKANRKPWSTWISEKKAIEISNKEIQKEKERKQKIFEEEKKKIAQQTYKKWVVQKKMQPVFETENQKSDCDKSEANRPQDDAWDMWCQKKKTTQVSNYKYTHLDYPEPSWVNPKPWKSAGDMDDDDAPLTYNINARKHL